MGGKIKRVEAGGVSLESVERFYAEYPYPSPHKVDVSALRKKLEWVARSLPAGSLRGSSVLDVGCGTGVIGCALALDAKHVFGVDFARGSLERARDLAGRLGVRNVKFVFGDIFDWKIRTLFDHVFCIGVLHHTENARQGFLNISRNVKRSGYITIGLYELGSNLAYFALQKLVDFFLPGKRLRVKLLSAFFRNKDLVVVADTYAHPRKTFHAPKEVAGWFSESGFVVVGVRREKGFFIISGQRRNNSVV